MGYYTNYYLEVLEPNGQYVDCKAEEYVEKTIESLSGYDVEPRTWTQDIKWYDHEKDLEELSIRLPNVLLKLEGCGEGDGIGDLDLWVKFFKNGKMYKEEAKIVLDKEFKEDKLK